MSLILHNKNILFLFLTSFFRAFLVMIPILTLYFQKNGLTIQEVMILQTIFSVIIVVLEIPSGYLADLFKRKYLISIGAFFALLGIIGYYFLTSFWGFILVEILLGIGISLQSGADTAYLYDELLAKKQVKKYQEIEGKYMSISSFSEATASLFSSFLIIFGFKIVVLAQIITNFLSFFFSLFLKEHKKNTKEIDRLTIGEVSNFLLRENTNIKFLILFSSIIGTSTLVFVWLAQPFWKEKGLSIEYFGILWALLNLLVGVFSLFAYKLEKFLSFKKLFILFWIFTFIFYFLLGFSQNIILILLLSSGFWIFRGLNGPILKDYINREIDSKMRATVLSIKNLFFRIIFSILSPFIGYFADIYSFQIALFVSAGIFFLLGGFSLIFILFHFTKQSINLGKK